MGTDYAGNPTWHDTITIPADNDKPDAATFNLALEPIIDRTKWIKDAHLPDQYVKSKISNTSGTAYPANIWWSGTHTFAAGKQVTFNGPVVANGALTANGVATLNGAVTIHNPLVVNSTLEVTGTSTFGGIPTFDSVAFLNGGGKFSGRVEYSGDGAYQTLRSVTGPDGSVNIDAHHADLLIVPDITASRAWTLNDPPSNRVVKSIVHWPVSTGASKRFTLNSGTRTLASVRSNTVNADGSVATFYLISRPGGAGWTLVASNVPKQRFDGEDADMIISAWLYDVIMVPLITSLREYTLEIPPADYPPFETVIHWPNQVGSQVLAIRDGLGAIYEVVTSGALTSSGIATVVMGWNGSRYYRKSKMGPY